MKSHFSVRSMAFIALFAALLAVCAWITVPYVVPFTMQTFAVFAAVGLLGLKNGTISVLVYIALGAIGLPVFSSFNSGVGYLMGTTGGYLTGFIFSAIVTGLLLKKLDKSFIGIFLSMTVGLLVCYVFGTAWFMVVYTKNTGPIGLYTALSWCVLPFIIPDLAKIALASIIVKRLKKYIKL